MPEQNAICQDISFNEHLRILSQTLLKLGPTDIINTNIGLYNGLVPTIVVVVVHIHIIRKDIYGIIW